MEILEKKKLRSLLYKLNDTRKIALRVVRRLLQALVEEKKNQNKREVVVVV